jgi:hypothetical protein
MVSRNDTGRASTAQGGGIEVPAPGLFRSRLPLAAMDASPKAERINMYLVANHPSFDIAYQFVTLGQRQCDLLWCKIGQSSCDATNLAFYSFPSVGGEFELDRPLHDWTLVAAFSSSLRRHPHYRDTPADRVLLAANDILNRKFAPLVDDRREVCAGNQQLGHTEAPGA